MKKIIVLVVLLSTGIIYAQNFQGKATYKTSRKSNVNLGNDKNSQITDEMRAQFQARLRKMNQKTFILEFDKTTSLYKEEEKLNAPNLKPKGTRVVVMNLGGSGKGSIYYKNIKDKSFAKQTEIMGKVFLVKDQLPKYDWKMTTEVKNIGKYTCYKATYTEEVENKKMSFVNGEMKEKVTKETKVTTAWYTLEIPISNGPDDYQGLPGLILELTTGKTTLLCYKIV